MVGLKYLAMPSAGQLNATWVRRVLQRTHGISSKLTEWVIGGLFRRVAQQDIGGSEACIFVVRGPAAN